MISESDKVANKLKLKPVGTVNLEVDGFASIGEKKVYNIVKVPIHTNDGTIEISALTIDQMPSRLSMPGRGNLVKKLLIKGITLADDDKTGNYTDLYVIIGIDNYYKFVKSSPISEQVHTIDSNLGTILTGTIPCSTKTNSNVATVLKVGTHPGDENLNTQLAKFWELESVGIRDSCQDDKIALDKFEKSIKFSQGKYSVGLPWTNDDLKLPTNENLALNRLNSLWNSLSKDECKLDHYDKIIRDQIKAGFIEKVDNCAIPNLGTHYIPHHAVAKDSDTTPIRVVFDCSAKSQKSQPSLNDCLLTGPSLVQDMISLLLKFRVHKYVSVSDIEKAFHMIELNESDRDFCRFFWPENPRDPNSKIDVYRFKVVLFGATPSQFLLNATLKHHLDKYSNQNSDKIKNNIYVDNVIVGYETEQEMLDFYFEAKKIMNAGGFNLREWNSNSSNISSKFSENDKCSKSQIKILGVLWDIPNDQFKIKPFVPSNFENVTKRSIISSSSKTYEPLGYLLPLMINCKIFIQKLWKSEYGWDQILPKEIIEEWKVCVENLSNFELSIDRKFSSFKKPALHIFADASPRSYGAVAYFVEGENINFVMAKARLAPIKPPSLPQLELTAVNLAARLAQFIRNAFSGELEVAKTVIWTDSEIVLHWLASTINHTKPYVRQRIADIRALFTDAIFSHVKSEDNVADLVTRGLSAKEFRRTSHWVDGPKWLTGPCQMDHSKFVVQCAIHCNVEHKNEDVFDVQKFSTYQKLLRVAGWVLRFKNNLKAKISKNEPTESKILSIDELKNAANELIRIDQSVHYGEILESLIVNERKIPIINQLDLTLIDGLIRSKGRLENSNLNYEAKFPVLLHPDSPLTRLIVLELHKFTLHGGVNYVLGTLRRRFWLPRGRQVIKKITRKCVNCRKVQSKPFPNPPHAPLPADRVRQCKPFEICGVDYTGAILVKDQDLTIKSYIVLFTCAVTRAVHLEVVYDLTEKSFLQALIKLSSRKSYPSVIISDNASYFQGSASTLKYISESEIVTDYLQKNALKWKFITPRAAWHGGMYERIIGLVKDTFKKVVGKALLHKFEFETIVTQIECKLNDRPLTYVSDDNNDFESITPSKLMFGHNLKEFPSLLNDDVIDDPTYGEKQRLSKSFLYRTKILNDFWSRWKHEYLASLRERFLSKDKSSPHIAVGQVVLLGDEGPRVSWKLGLITKLFPSSDEFIRSVEVKTENSVLVRPISKLYPLEICSVETNLVEPLVNSISRPKREAALKALRLMNIQY